MPKPFDLFAEFAKFGAQERMYSDGEGVEQNFVEAARWYRKSAEQDYSLAQFG